MRLPTLGYWRARRRQRPPSWHLWLGLTLSVILALLIGVVGLYLLAHWHDARTWE